MRRAFAIFFLVLVLLNTAGYYLVFQGMKWHNALTFTPDGSSSEELIVKIPFAVPYSKDADEWTPAQGRYEHEGQSYQIVRQRLAMDAVYLALVKDAEATRINSEMADFAKTFSDKQTESKQQSAKVFPSIMKEYISDRILVRTVDEGWTQLQPPAIHFVFIVHSFVSSVIHPPERA